ncbi:hypothetical protein AUR64_02040 [Haloprofundus marisrubri]|uniref:Glycosyltransferase RgtA/B/C/D-like domain-containing protein n=1 Tax=Haloprofundus marisrubri TaxID=1514971 RepID=A0A0W1R3D7_9EURY|nr:hypothetical protein [Haloprofundus marisrubri]KTG07833.1 hypothetical protein AUR64_02040 [Haloprofundus marisrubri]
MSFRQADDGSDGEDLVATGLLAVGFFALAGAILYARSVPATGYELSIYAGTPVVVWGAIGAAVLVAAVYALFLPPSRTRLWALVLGGSAVTTIVSMPLIRGYFFVGVGDSLSHLGWARSIQRASILPQQMFYPSIHSLTDAIDIVTAMGLRRSMMLVVVVTLVAFLIFVPLTARAMTGSSRALVFGALSAWLLLPINHIAVHLMPHPSTQAIFIATLAVYLLVRYVQSSSDDVSGGPFAFGALFFLVGAGLVLYHPMQALNLFILCGTVGLIQFLARRRAMDSIVASHRPVYAQTGLLGLFLFAWMVPRERFQGAFEGVYSDILLGNLVGGERAQTVSDGAVSVGASLPELFVKIFLVSTVYAALTGLFFLLTSTGRLDDDVRSQSLVLYLGAALVPLVGLFAVYFVGSPTLGYRQLGFIFVVATIVGAVALSKLVGGLQSRLTFDSARSVAAVAMVVMLAMSMVVIFPSPYIVKTTQHVSEQQYSGFETTFEHRNEEVFFSSAGVGPERFSDAVYGFENVTEPVGVPVADAQIDPANRTTDSDLSNVSGQFEGPRYFVTTDMDSQREVLLYNEKAYTRADYESLPTQRQLNLVQSNSEYTLYVTRDGFA